MTLIAVTSPPTSSGSGGNWPVLVIAAAAFVVAVVTSYFSTFRRSRIHLMPLPDLPPGRARGIVVRDSGP